MFTEVLQSRINNAIDTYGWPAARTALKNYRCIVGSNDGRLVFVFGYTANPNIASATGQVTQVQIVTGGRLRKFIGSELIVCNLAAAT